MIFYFTGTGNSLWVAKELGKALNEPLTSIADSIKANAKEYHFEIKPDEKIVFVYPVHSWGPPVIVTDFISRLKLAGYTEQTIYSVCTCGDDCGYTTDIIAKALQDKKYKLTDSYSVTMPNNYTLFPGFDVDTKEVENQKLINAPVRLQAVVETILAAKKENLYHQGTVPFIKSRIINPLFIKFALGKTNFHINNDCISCGLCEKICPTRTISMVHKHPVWGEQCIQCLACLNRCPVRAIDYGKITLTKGRYHHPDLK